MSTTQSLFTTFIQSTGGKFLAGSAVLLELAGSANAQTNSSSDSNDEEGPGFKALALCMLGFTGIVIASLGYRFLKAGCIDTVSTSDLTEKSTLLQDLPRGDDAFETNDEEAQEEAQIDDGLAPESSCRLM